METDKIESIMPAEPRTGEVLEITSATLADLAGKIADSIGKPLHDRITEEIKRGITLSTIPDNATYVLASEERKTLKGLISAKGDPRLPGRLQVIMNLGIIDENGEKIAIGAKTSIGLVSLDDLYGPLADMYHKLHRATTQGQGTVAAQIEAVRGMLEASILGWEAEMNRRQKEAEEKQRKANEQLARVERAKHWVGLLAGHGYDEAAILGILGHGLEVVTDTEVDTLEDLLNDELLKTETTRQEADRQEAIRTAKEMGLSNVVRELEEKADEPIAVEVPAPPAPPRAMPVFSSIAGSPLPRVKGQGSKPVYVLIIEKPELIPAEYLLPPAKKMFDPEEYPRLRAKMGIEGTTMNVPGVRVEEKQKLTQR